MKPVAILLVLLFLPALLGAEMLESRYGNFRVETDLKPGHVKDGRGITAWVARVMTRSGTVLYAIEHDIPYGSPFPRMQVSDHAGETVMVDAFSGVVEFYGARGGLVRRWQPFGEASPDHERILKCAVAGDRVAFLLSASTLQQATLVMCTATGREMWTRPLTHNSGSELHMADDGGIVIVSSYRLAGSDFSGTPGVATEIIDGNGATLHVLPVLMRHAGVSPSGDRFVVADRNEIVFGSVNGSSEHRHWSSGPGEGTITGVACAGETTAVVVEQIQAESGGIRYANPTAVFLNQAGIEVRREALSGTSVFSTRLVLREGQFRLQNPDAAIRETVK